MPGDNSYLVEDFINAITAQLDRVQDSLRVKAVNRPLTYALKDLALDLQVFVEMDNDGHVRFRSSGPNEAGSSTIHIGFTTITRPMIDENTISLAVSRSPSLDELGLDPDERKRLEQIGVSNAAQLQNLGAAAGHATISRLSGIPVDRLRAALGLSRPRLSQVTPEPDGNVAQAPGFQRTPPQAVVRQPAPGFPIVRVAPGVSRLRLAGRHLTAESGPPDVRLDGEPLSIAHADDDHVIVQLPPYAQSGTLSVQLPDGDESAYELRVEPSAEPVAVGADPWVPGHRP